jgi:ferredoxin
MVMKINSDECTACGDCATACPNEAISSKSAYYIVNADKCNECEEHDLPKCQDACPANCIDFS